MNRKTFLAVSSVCGLSALGVSQSQAATALYWNSAVANASWDVGTNWSTDAAGTSASTGVPDSSVDAYLNSTPLNSTPTSIYLYNTAAANSLTFNNTGGTTIQAASKTGRIFNLGGGGILLNSGAGAVLLGGNTVVVTTQASQSWTNNSSGNLRIYNAMKNADGQAATLTLDGSGSGGFLFSNAINDGANGGTLGLVVNITGSGTANLGATNNTFSGGVLIKAGAVAAKPNATVEGGYTLGVAGSSADTSLTFSADGTFLDSITTVAGTLGGQTLSTGKAVVLANTLALNSTSSALTITGTSGNLTLAGNVTGNGGIFKSGSTVLTLQSANDYKGGTTLSAGKLSIGDDAALGIGALTLGNLGTIQSADGTSHTIANVLTGLAGTGNSTYTFGTVTTNTGSLTFTSTAPVALATAASTQTFTVNADTSFANDFTAPSGVALTKKGSATLTLGGTNTYDGTTSVTAGTLVVNGSLAGAATLSTNTTLGGSGLIAGLVTASASGATVAPGNSAGTLTVGALSMGTGTVLTYDLNAANHTVGSGINDEILVNGNLTLDGTINLTNLTNLSAGTYTLLHYTGNLTNNGLLIGSNFGSSTGQEYAIAIDSAGKNVNLTVTPEPGSLALVGAGTVGLLLRRKRKA